MFLKEWGIDKDNAVRGGVAGMSAQHGSSPRKAVYLLQRKSSKFGAGLGKTTGWIHRASLKHRKVQMIGSVEYKSVDDQGLHIEVKGKDQILDVDTIIVCAGQQMVYDLEAPLQEAGFSPIRIGGAERAGELDAKRAINQGSRLAAAIETYQLGQPLEPEPTFSSKAMDWVMNATQK